MKNMKIRTKLLASFLIIAILTAIVGGVGVYAVTTVAADTVLLNARAGTAIASAQLGRNIETQRATYRGAILFDALGKEEKVKSSAGDLKDLAATFETDFAALSAACQTDDEKRLASALGDAYAVFAPERDKLMDEINAPNTPAEAYVRELEAILTPCQNVIDASVKLTEFIDDLTNRMADEAAATSRLVTGVLIAVLIFAVAAALLLGVYIASIISKPINRMAGFLKQVGETGNLEFPDGDWADARAMAAYKDETAQSLAAFLKMLEHLTYYGKSLESVAGRDLTVRVKTLGVGDTMGNALAVMVENLNQMFEEINTSANQVSIGSQQIADGAQNLAQGSTQQAASVEQLSSAITEVSGSVKDAANSARNAADLAVTIRGKAESGSEQMTAMMEAVREINEASQDIGRVIKAIDDIAFQTNILALNAAVEAARAGAAGKGFAVVADEVRNLAAKSAESAKDTGSLIENSIAKAELGVKIAGEMDTSLREIVDGIVESSQISNEIAVGADRQAAAIMEITTGIDQVAQVVQQNSATAEESAAASEELSGQSAILNNLIGQFRLSGAAGKYASFAQGAQKKPEHVISLEHPSADKFGAYDKY